jgi:glycerophosphoryl diester phosphodiesterase
MNGHKIQVWAHRGASAYAPENTMEAYILAHQYGADGIELDVHLSKDGEIVVIHDEKVNRTSDGKGYVRNYTLKQLKKFNYNRTRPTHFHAEIPTLRDVLEYLQDKPQMSLNIELKTNVFSYDGIEQKTIDLVHQTGMAQRVIYSSFNHYSIRRVQQIDPEAKVGLLYEDGFIDVPQYAAKLGVDALHPKYINLRYPGYLEDCRRFGLDINVWTINDEQMMRDMCAAGVHAIITNDPALAIRVRDEFERTGQAAGGVKV